MYGGYAPLVMCFAKKLKTEQSAKSIKIPPLLNSKINEGFSYSPALLF